MVQQSQLHLPGSALPEGPIVRQSGNLRERPHQLLPVGVAHPQQIDIGIRRRVRVSDDGKPHIVFCVRPGHHTHRRPGVNIHIPHRGLHQEILSLPAGKIGKITAVGRAVVIRHPKASALRVEDQGPIHPFQLRSAAKVSRHVAGIIPVQKGRPALRKQSHFYIAASQGSVNGYLSGKQFLFVKGSRLHAVDKQVVIPRVIRHRKLHATASVGSKGKIVLQSLQIGEPLHDLLSVRIAHTQRISIGICVGVAHHGKPHIVRCVRPGYQARRRPKLRIHIPHRCFQQEGLSPLFGKVRKIPAVGHTVVVDDTILPAGKIIYHGAVDPLHPGHILQISGRIRRIIPAGKGNPSLPEQAGLHLASAQGVPDGNLTGKQLVFTQRDRQSLVYKHMIIPVPVRHGKLHNAFFVRAEGLVIRQRLNIGKPFHDFLSACVAHPQRVHVRVGIGVAHYGEAHIMRGVGSHQHARGGPELGIHIAHPRLHQEGLAGLHGKIPKIASVCQAVAICHTETAGDKVPHKRPVNPLHPGHLTQIPGEIPGIRPVCKGCPALGKQPRPHASPPQGIPNGNLAGKQLVLSEGRSHYVIYKHIIISAVIYQSQLHVAVPVRPEGHVIFQRVYVGKPPHDLLPLGVSSPQRKGIRLRIGIAHHGEPHIMLRVRSHQQAHRRPKLRIHIPHRGLHHKGPLLLDIGVLKITAVGQAAMIQNAVDPVSLMVQKRPVDPLHLPRPGQIPIRVGGMAPAGKRGSPLGKQAQLHPILSAKGIPDGNLVGEQFSLVKGHSRIAVDKHIVKTVLVRQAKLHTATGSEGIIVRKRLDVGEPFHDLLSVGVPHPERVPVRPCFRIADDGKPYIVLRVGSHQQTGRRPLAGIHIADHRLQRKGISLLHRSPRQITSVCGFHMIADPVAAGRGVILEGIMKPLRNVSNVVLYPVRSRHRKYSPDLSVLPDSLQWFSVQVDHILPAAGHRDGHSHLRQNRHVFSVDSLTIQGKPRLLRRRNGKLRSHHGSCKDGEGVLGRNAAEGAVRAGHVAHNAVPDARSGQVIATLHAVKQHVVYIEEDPIAVFVQDQRQPALAGRKGNALVALGVLPVVISHHAAGGTSRRKELYRTAVLILQGEAVAGPPVVFRPRGHIQPEAPLHRLVIDKVGVVVRIIGVGGTHVSFAVLLHIARLDRVEGNDAIVVKALALKPFLPGVHGKDMLLALRENALKGKRVASVGGKGSSAQLILAPAKQHHVKHPTGGGQIPPGEQPGQLPVAAFQRIGKADHRRAVVPGHLPRHTDTALRRQRRKYRVDQHGLGRLKPDDAVLHAGHKAVVLRPAVDQQIRQYISLGGTHGQLHRLAAVPADSQFVQGEGSAGNAVGDLDHMHVLVRQRGKRPVVLRSLVVLRLPAAVFHLGAQGVQAGTGPSSQPVQIQAEGIDVVYDIVITGVIFNHPDVDGIASHGLHAVPPQHIVPERLVKVQGIVGQRLPAALQIRRARNPQAVELGGAPHVAHAGRGSRVVDSPGKLHIHGVGVAGGFDLREEYGLAVLRRSAHLPNAVRTALQAGQIPAVGFCVAVGGVAQLRSLAAHVDIAVLIKQQRVVHAIVIHLREGRLQKRVVRRLKALHIAVHGHNAGKIRHPRLRVYRVVQILPGGKKLRGEGGHSRPVYRPDRLRLKARLLAAGAVLLVHQKIQAVKAEVVLRRVGDYVEAERGVVHKRSSIVPLHVFVLGHRRNIQTLFRKGRGIAQADVLLTVSQPVSVLPDLLREHAVDLHIPVLFPHKGRSVLPVILVRASYNVHTLRGGLLPAAAKEGGAGPRK